jgi:tRNA (Thr-GGU) A37 N-methylase
VQPPRSETKRGVFATRAPRRPNPIGMSLVKLERIEGTTLHVRGLDLLDGTPVIGTVLSKAERVNTAVYKRE